VIGTSVGSGAMSIAQTDDQGIQHVTIMMDSYAYSPQEISVQVGKPVELTLHNTATFIPHTFVLDDPLCWIVHLCRRERRRKPNRPFHAEPVPDVSVLLR
jgi:hypothetical protein